VSRTVFHTTAATSTTLPACATELVSSSSSSTRNGKLVSITSRLWVCDAIPRISTSTLGKLCQISAGSHRGLFVFSEASRKAKHCKAFYLSSVHHQVLDMMFMNYHDNETSVDCFEGVLFG
jgi:hypothetical protein